MTAEDCGVDANIKRTKAILLAVDDRRRIG